MIKSQGENRLGSVFSLLIFCAFAAAVLMVLMLGARVYRDVAARNEAAWDQRMALAYIEAKIRHNDTLDDVKIGPYIGYEEIAEIETLYLEQHFGDYTYHTMIYLSDGWVYEMFCEKGLEFNPSDGTKILEAQALDFEFLDDNGLLKITCVDSSGNPMSMIILPRSEEGVQI